MENKTVRIGKRFLALLLSFVMVFGLLPAMTLASEDAEAEPQGIVMSDADDSAITTEADEGTDVLDDSVDAVEEQPIEENGAKKFGNWADFGKKFVRTERQMFFAKAKDVKIEGALPVRGSVKAERQDFIKSWWDLAFNMILGTNAADETVAADAQPAAEEPVDILASFDITILDADEEEWQPEKGQPVEVTLTDESFGDGRELTIYHESEDGLEFVANVVSVNNTVTFKAEHFSVYVVVETGEDARLFVNFVQYGGTTKTMMINKRQIPQIEQYIFDPGANQPEGTVFKGWTTEEDYDADTEAETIANVREDIKAELNKEGGITDGDALTYYAMVFNAYDVIYLDEKSNVIETNQVLIRADDTSGKKPVHNVTLDYTPYPPEQAGSTAAQFVGWQQLEPEVTGDMILYKPGDSFTLEVSRYVLAANTQYGNWLSFDENLSNASYTEPQFIAINGKPTAPDAPVRQGYTFDGWYTEDADPDERDGAVQGELFDFSKILTESKTVYAKWNKANTVDYSVVIWLMNVDGESYDYGETITVSNATVGQNTYSVSAQTVNGRNGVRINTGSGNTDRSYVGFHLSRNDDPKAVAAEGNTVINVYFDRNSHTFTFQNNNTTIHTVTRLYGQDISDIWSFTGSDGTTYPRTNPPTSWTPHGSSTYTQRITRMEIMPDEDIRFTHTTSSNTIRYFHYYVEALPGATNTRTYNGTQYSLYTDLTHDFNIIYYNDDFWNLEGFTRQAIATANGTTVNISNSGTNWQNSWNSNLYFYYTRNKYDIIYKDGIFVNGGGLTVDAINRGEITSIRETQVPYQSDITGKNKTAEYAGFVFLGWYDNEGCVGDPYTFTTMPANNVTVYAKWGLKEYEVNLHPNADGDGSFKYTSDSQQPQFWVDEGEKIGNVGGERDYYNLVGWYSDSGLTKPFNFDTYAITEKIIEKYGHLFTESEIDPEYPTTVGKIDLYARWRSKLIGAEGITIEYLDDLDKGKLEEPVSDGLLYVADAEANAHDAFEAKAPDTYVFSHWEVQKWNGTAYVASGVNVFPSETFVVKTEDAKITDATTGAVVTGTLDKNGEYVYTIQLKAVYIEKDKEIKSFINWYLNYEGAANDGLYEHSDNLSINQACDVPDAPERTGYKFLGWIRGVEETDASTTSAKHVTTLEDLYITYENGVYSSTQVAPDEMLVNDNAEVGTGEAYKYHHAMYAKWVPILTIKVIGETDEKVYNGTEQSVSGTTIEYYLAGEKQESAPAGVTVAVTGDTATGKDVADDPYPMGLTKDKVTVTIADNAEVAYDPDDETSLTVEDGSLTINPAVVTLTSESGEKPYDGTPLTKPTVEVSGDGATIFQAEVSEIKATGSVTTVAEGEVDNTITYTEGTNFKAANYDINKTEGKLKITASTEALVIESSTKSWPYDGTIHKDETYTVTYKGKEATADSTGKVFTLSTGDTVTITATAAGV
ncbi:MAG: InlB B-repeat-containing protein, partial [Clostridiales bacterium]|nr:InlB B-repeat-containing protein [Clostridiales bacterium]